MKKTQKILILIILFIQIFSLTVFANPEIKTPSTLKTHITNNAENTENNENTNLELDCESAILLEEKTGIVVYEKNSNEKLYPASTTKILTAILVLENCKLSDSITVTESSINSIPTGYVIGDLRIGEKFTIENMLYALMLKSANDVAVLLAEHVSGSVENFADLMNQKAIEIGCKNTHFVNPNGIHSDDHYTTASDLALIAKYCMKNETFRKIVSTQEYTLPKTNLYAYENRSFDNTNNLILSKSSYYYENATGIKTGYTKEAGSCLISSATKDDINYIGVVLNSNSNKYGKNTRFTDSKKLFEYGFENFEYNEFKKQNEVIEKIEIENATAETKNLNLLLEKNLISFNNVNFDFQNLEPKIELKENIMAPIAKDEILGTATYIVDDIEYKSNLLAANAVEEQPNYWIFIIGFILLFVGIILLLIKPKNKKKNRVRKRK